MRKAESINPLSSRHRHTNKNRRCSQLTSPHSKNQHTHTYQHHPPPHLPHSTIKSTQLTTSTSCAPEESAATLPALTASTRPSKKSCVSRKAPLLSAVLGSGYSSTSSPTMSLALVSSVLRPVSARWLCRMVGSTRKTSRSDGDKVCLHVGWSFVTVADDI
jgi:hypothetical protein